MNYGRKRQNDSLIIKTRLHNPAIAQVIIECDCINIVIFQLETESGICLCDVIK